MRFFKRREFGDPVIDRLIQANAFKYRPGMDAMDWDKAERAAEARRSRRVDIATSRRPPLRILEHL